jgi:hypothetical protein
MVGFITLTGIAVRNGILKVSHYINLCKFEGEQFGQSMVVRGSLERLTPVLMTALVAAFALTPLLLSADAAGKEILHPVAVVIFGGLVSSTLLDTLLTPLMYLAFGRTATESFWLQIQKPKARLSSKKRFKAITGFEAQPLMRLALARNSYEKTAVCSCPGPFSDQHERHGAWHCQASARRHCPIGQRSVL